MIKNFFKIAFRNIYRHKAFTFINVTGLAIGLAASLLILLWVQDELSFEKFNTNGSDIYRVEEDQFYSGRRYHVTVTPHPSGPEWMQKIPEISEQTRYFRLPRILFRYNDKVFFESSLVAADSGILRMFTFPVISGDPVTALSSPNSIVLTEKLARKYFGSENPIGKAVTLENNIQLLVSAVVKDPPRNSMFRFEALIPYSFLKKMGMIDDNWGNNSIFTFVMVQKGADIETVNKKLTDVVIDHNPETTTKYSLFPLLDIHLHGQFGFYETRGPVIAIAIFSLIAIFIILIACINFINLSTAKASTRGKEIGIKKVAGADRASMILQFLLESLLLVAFAMIIAIILVSLSLNIFNTVSGKSFVLADLLHSRFIISFLIVGLIAGLVSGLYPALYLSSFRPAAVLKGENVTGKGHGRFRKILVVVQFTLSILIAISAIFMYKELKFLQNKDLGFNKEQLICIPMPDPMKSKYQSLKTELLNEPLIPNVTASTWNPVNIGSNSGGADWDGKDPEKHVLIGNCGIDYDYLETMGISLVSGRDFSKDYATDMARDTTGNFLVNEEVAKLMDVADPVGMNFRFMGLRGKIVGVMKDFNFKGADQPIEPLAFALTDLSWLRVILIKLSGNIPEALKSVDKVWKEVIPEYPLEYTFVDQDYDNLFRSQMRLIGLLKYFTILTVIIACLGLYGLSSYSAERRTNEVGIRKVMGAGSLDVMFTLSVEFLTLVVVSLIIAIPLGWIIVEKLLKQFASRIDLNIAVFAVIALGAIFIALFTVSFQAYRASGTNPAEALKVE
ncbi:MAG TPA: ABC transporter permease [Bacteroidales bacterium]|nr:ABC transporter permease [Bacteroidales bacterium]